MSGCRDARTSAASFVGVEDGEWLEGLAAAATCTSKSLRREVMSRMEDEDVESIIALLRVR